MALTSLGSSGYDYDPWGKALASGPERKGYIDKEKDRESGLTNMGVRMYDDGAFRSPDPLWEWYRASSPYAYCVLNPLRVIDPSGQDWFEVGGQWAFIKDKHEIEVSHVNENGEVSVEKVRGVAEIIVFDGKILSWYKANGSIQSWIAVSGDLKDGATDPGSQLKMRGPIPEGNYFIDPKDVQKRESLSTLQKLEGMVGKGRWPGGERSWGNYRVPIMPKKDDVGERTGDYFIHGGDVPGSRGCIDLTHLDASFFGVFSPHTIIVPLKVEYHDANKSK